jgi:rubrerythrin
MQVRWYCPGCGVAIERRDKPLQCPECGRLMDDFVYELIEFHPHRTDSGDWK